MDDQWDMVISSMKSSGIYRTKEKDNIVWRGKGGRINVLLKICITP